MKKIIIWLAGVCAGAVTGLLGTGGGMLLVPILRYSNAIADRALFPSSVAIILPICIVNLLLGSGPMPAISQALPYLAGSAIGGLLCLFIAKKLSVKWLHRGLGILMIWGGLRLLW